MQVHVFISYIIQNHRHFIIKLKSINGRYRRKVYHWRQAQVSITQQNSIINNNINYAVEAFKIKQGFIIL